MAAAALGAPARAQGPVTLRFLWWGGSDRHARTLKALQAFEAGHPGVRVKAEYMGFNGYLEKLTTQMVGGTEPDLLQINWAWLAMFSRQGTGFLDLTNLVDGGAGIAGDGVGHGLDRDRSVAPHSHGPDHHPPRLAARDVAVRSDAHG